MVPTGARTITVPSSRLRGWLAGFTERHGDTHAESGPDLVALIGADDARAWIEVPFPPLTGELADHVERVRRVGVLLVRRGGQAVGVFQGSNLVASKVDSSYVQGTTKAGGWSQQRYARRRANQSKAAFADAADIAARILLPAVGTLDAVVCGGDRKAVDAVLADRRLMPVAALVTGHLLTVPDPRLRVLEVTPEQFLGVRISLLP